MLETNVSCLSSVNSLAMAQCAHRGTMPSTTDKFREYKERDLVLQHLGYASYGQYLSSPLWSKIKAMVKERSKGICECCLKRRSRQVHHADYLMKTLNGESIEALVDLCGRCHSRVEIIWAKVPRKRGFQKAQRLLVGLTEINKLKASGSLYPDVEVFCDQCGSISHRPSSSWKRGKHPKCECGGHVHQTAYRTAK